MYVCLTTECDAPICRVQNIFNSWFFFLNALSLCALTQQMLWVTYDYRYPNEKKYPPKSHVQKGSFVCWNKREVVWPYVIVTLMVQQIWTYYTYSAYNFAAFFCPRAASLICYAFPFPLMSSIYLMTNTVDWFSPIPSAAERLDWDYKKWRREHYWTEVYHISGGNWLLHKLDCMKLTWIIPAWLMYMTSRIVLTCYFLMALIGSPWLNEAVAYRTATNKVHSVIFCMHFPSLRLSTLFLSPH